jgi:hypothetical protein
MIHISARKLLKANPYDLWKQLTDKYLVKFDDCSIEMYGADIAISRYSWVLHERNPELPLLSSMTCMQYLNQGVFTVGQTRSLFNDVMWAAYDYFQAQGNPVSAYDLVEVFQWANLHFYNAATVHCASFVTSLWITDYIDLVYHPKLLELKVEAKQAKYNTAAVEVAIGKATKLMATGQLRDHNGNLYAIPLSCLAGIIKPPQAVQAVFMRGSVPDINMESIAYPIVNSLTEGMNTPIEYAILSREGAIAEMASLDDLRQVCFSGRKLALVAQSKTTVVNGDCGSTNYVYWPISSPVYNKEGKVVKKSDLNEVIGIWYVTEGGLKQVTAKDTHLYGKTIQIRSILTCRLAKGNHVCSKCVGAMSEVWPEEVNLGTDIAKTFTEDKSQATLSIKHLLASLTANGGKLNAAAKRYLHIVDNMYYLHPQVAEEAQEVLIEIPTAYVNNITQLDGVEDVRNLVPSKIAAFPSVTFHFHSAKPHSVTLSLTQGAISCSLSYEILNLLHRVGVGSLVSYNDTSIIINITPVKDKPLFIIPPMLPSLSELSLNLSRIFERAGDERSLSRTDIMGTLERLHSLLQEMGGAHLSMVQLLLSSYLVTGDSYAVANAVHGLSELEHAEGHSLLLRRSLSNWLIYNSSLQGIIFSPAAFLPQTRDDSVLDPFIDPIGVMKHIHH